MDDRSILDRGSGQAMPYLAIFNSSGDPILHPVTKDPVGTFMESFEYKYREEDDDEVEIIFKAGSPNFLEDISEFRDKRAILLQWGYVFPSGEVVSGAIRKAIIRDDEFDGDRQGNYRFTLKATDGLSLLKTQPVDRYHDSFEEWVKYNLRGLDSVKFIKYKTRGVIKFGDKKYKKDKGEYRE